MSTTVLVVDDEPIVREVVVSYLEREGYRTLEAGDGDTARRLVEEEPPGLVVLDVMLPGTDGLELCRWIRARSDLPVIMLTARGDEADRIVGLDLGADDYVTKPFSPRELAARVRTVLRRTAPSVDKAERLSFDGLDIDGRTREELMDHLWKGSFYGDLRSVDVHVRHLRQKIEASPSEPVLIRTVRGVGYAFGREDGRSP